MTVKEQLTKMIVERGLFDHMAETILTTYVDNEALTEVYHKPWADYPMGFHAAAWLVASQAVVDWMDAERPMHFARSLFVVPA
jgi:hypothetical protein